MVASDALAAPVVEVIGTAGGTFNRDRDRHCYFLAASADRQQQGASQHPYLLIAVNELQHGQARDYLEQWLDLGCRVLLDSGIFWMTNLHARAHGIGMDEALGLPPEDIDGFDKLWTDYVALVETYGSRLWGYVELDQGGRDRKRQTRQKLHDIGIRPIPVYHPLLDGWDYFDELAENYDRICFGNVVQANAETRRRLMMTAWERHRLYPDLWIHLLGLTPNEWLHALPVDSCDSSTWLNVVRWNGHSPSAMLKSFGHMDLHYRYKLGDREGDRGSVKACNMSAAAMSLDQVAMRQWRHRIDDEFSDGQPWPPRLDVEGPLQSGAARIG